MALYSCTPSLTLAPQQWMDKDKPGIIPRDTTELGAHEIPGGLGITWLRVLARGGSLLPMKPESQSSSGTKGKICQIYEFRNKLVAKSWEN